MSHQHTVTSKGEEFSNNVLVVMDTHTCLQLRLQMEWGQPLLLSLGFLLEIVLTSVGLPFLSVFQTKDTKILFGIKIS